MGTVLDAEKKLEVAPSFLEAHMGMGEVCWVIQEKATKKVM